MAAKALYSEYLRIAFENPHLANPSISNISYSQLKFNDDSLMFEKYELFVTLMVNAYEEIFFLSKDKALRHEIISNLAYHKEYFSSYHYTSSDYIKSVGINIKPLIQKLMKGIY
jgi:hypothetical protein